MDLQLGKSEPQTPTGSLREGKSSKGTEHLIYLNI